MFRIITPYSLITNIHSFMSTQHQTILSIITFTHKIKTYHTILTYLFTFNQIQIDPTIHSYYHIQSCPHSSYNTSSLPLFNNIKTYHTIFFDYLHSIKKNDHAMHTYYHIQLCIDSLYYTHLLPTFNHV